MSIERKKYKAKWYQANKEYLREQMREAHIERTYGLSIEEYDAILAAQGGRCAICGTDTPKHRGRFCVDHDHITGKIRGLLCHACNSRLGVIENGKWVELATAYLGKFK